jgi:hypothetical protein
VRSSDIRAHWPNPIKEMATVVCLPLSPAAAARSVLNLPAPGLVQDERSTASDQADEGPEEGAEERSGSGRDYDREHVGPVLAGVPLHSVPEPAHDT